MRSCLKSLVLTNSHVEMICLITVMSILGASMTLLQNTPIVPIPELPPPPRPSYLDCEDCRDRCADDAWKLGMTSAPVPPQPETKPLPPPAPFVFEKGETNWGLWDGRGKDFILEGHPVWSAVVQFRQRKDGSTWVWVLWTRTATGQPCPGVYLVEGRELHGIWGEGDSVKVDGDGQMTGSFREDVISWLPLPKPKP